MAEIEPKKKRIIFIHPDLGIGGAERLVIDAAVGLQSLGHKVTIFTSHCDPTHCFDEARNGTLDVRVRGNTIVPPKIFGRFAILCAILRQLHLVLSIAVFSNELESLRPTGFVVDQLSACVPLLRLVYSDARILFYCHFPDQLLAQKGSGAIGLARKAYRIPFNWLEYWSTGCADGIVVNSKFTGGIVKEVFPTLKKRTLKVVYPCVDTTAGEKKTARSKRSLWPGKTVFLSINRYERKKDVALAIKAFAGLDEKAKAGSTLVIAGGYDTRVDENVTYHRELERLADTLGLPHKTAKKYSLDDPAPSGVAIVFLLSVSDEVKQALLDSASLLIYTPENEHFGIVPLEAMLNEVPVLAADKGGPLETVVDGETGWLRNTTDVPSWTRILDRVFQLARSQPTALVEMGAAGRARVVGNFSKRTMALRLDKSLDDTNAVTRLPILDGVYLTIVLVTVFASLMGYSLMRLLFYMLESGGDIR